MGGINSLSGLNNVNVDFRPAITTNVQKSGNANQLLPEANVAPEEAPQEMGKAKSVVRELDVLLLNAAGKSVSADAVENVRTVVESLVDMGVLTSKEKSQLQSLAENAQAKLKALDKFSGRDLAKALMQDKKTGETVWSKGFFGLNSAAKAVKSAIEAQQTLSAKLGEKGLSNVVGAKALGFKPEDVDSATEESNIVSSRPLGAGAGGKTYLLTTKSGGELVFKPDNNIECVNDYTERNCSSIFKREYLHQMFDQPKTTA